MLLGVTVTDSYKRGKILETDTQGNGSAMILVGQHSESHEIRSHHPQLQHNQPALERHDSNNPNAGDVAIKSSNTGNNSSINSVLIHQRIHYFYLQKGVG